jgi:hypothetical protein
MDTHTHTLPFSADISRATRLARETTRLDLLADIDATVDMLAERSRGFRKASSVFSEIEAFANNSEIVNDQYLDPDDKALSAFRDVEESLKAYIPYMVRKRVSIDRDRGLSDEHRESLHDAYDDVLVNASLMLDAVFSARQAIIRHDLAAEPKENLPVFNTLEELIADLRA